MDPRWQAVALVVLTILAYVCALPNGFIWDDDHYVTANETLRSLHGLRLIWFDVHATPQYYPLVHSGFWIEYHLWGLNPLGYHVTNVLLHGLAAAGLFTCLRCLRVPGAWVAAAIFAVHPVTVESVAWITERKNVLSAVFYFLAMLTFMKSVSWNADTQEPVAKKTYACALLLFVCALLSKTVVCSLPAVLVLLIWRRCDRWTKREARDALLTIPFFVAGLTLAVNTVILERDHVGAKGVEWDFSFIERCLIAGRSIVFYAGKILWPDPLIFFYERWDINATMWWQYVFPVAVVLILVVTALMHKHWGKGLPAALMIFCGTLLPALGFFNVYPHRYSFVADHFQYLAMPAFIALVVAAATVGLRKLQIAEKPPVIAATAALLVAFILISNRQSAVYFNQETLWLDTIKKNPICWAAYNNLGNEYRDAKRYDEAIACFNNAIRIKPDHARAYANLGMVYASPEIAKYAKAEHYFSKAVELGLRDANVLGWLVKYYNGEGARAGKEGRREDAIRFAIKLLGLPPVTESDQQRIDALKKSLTSP